MTSRTLANRHDYLPAAGNDLFLPFYDLLSRALGSTAVHHTLLAQAGLESGHTVLEIGCGTGNLTVLAQHAVPGATVIGTDPDPRALARAERKAPGIRFERAYAQDLPHPDGSVDRVLSAFMLHHLDADTKAAVAAEAFRVLRPGGRLHIADVGGPMTAADGRAARRSLRSPYLRGNLGDALPAVLRTAGFETEQVLSHAHRTLGRVTYYRATHPGNARR
ncbi:class I SAM-dependent methyltransferase [Nocardia sp. NPDC057353]|uniref:class I SAM-dependent methyltransferase n=1 Tax=Nocardia sp. NPDC057353 TaxID=3346104 RepID=UPI003639B7A3